MSRPRKPTAILELNGAFKKDPQRARKKEPRPSGPLGNPPDRLTDAERAAWIELASLVPDRVLTNADRWLVELTCRLMARVWDDGLGGRHGVGVGELAQLTNCLVRMGLTPADRSKIGITEKEETNNPFASLDSEEQTDRPN